jgi:2,3-diphosphopglycerate-independent phosphoglycerate mutase
VDPPATEGSSNQLVAQSGREAHCQHSANERLWQQNKYKHSSDVIEVPTFQEQTGFKGFMIAPTAIISGIGQTIGLDVKQVEGATGDYHTNLINKGRAAFKYLSECDYDFCFLHVKAVDDAGHDKNLDLKVKFIEEVDRMYAEVLSLYKSSNPQFDLITVLTGDHTTPVSYGDHTFEPVPFVIASLSGLTNDLNGTLPRDNVERFDELSCSKGLLGRFTGGQIMKVVQSYMKL